MTKILTSVKNIASLLFLLVVVIVVVGFASGSVNMERIGYVVDVFKGELPEPQEEATEPTEEQRNQKVAEKMERTENERQQRDVDSAGDVRLESTREVIGLAVEDMQKDITAEVEKFEKEKQAFYEERKRIAEEEEAETFKDQVSILEKSEPAGAAKLLEDVGDERILRLFMQLKPQVVVEILRELDKHPAKNGSGTRGAELYKKLGEYKDALGTIDLQ